MNCLRQRNCIGMIVERDDEMVGFMVYELFRSTIHVLNFAIATEHRNRGYGRAMVDCLKSKIDQQKRQRITLEVSDSNIDAQRFFKAMGFKASRVIPGMYDNTSDAAYEMKWNASGDVDDFDWHEIADGQAKVFEVA